MGGSALLAVVLAAALLSISATQPDSKIDERLLCTCENDKGTCLNQTCRGYVCFHSWFRDFEERGCLSSRIYKEQCNGAGPKFYIKCCSNDHCNALTTIPPDKGQYPKLRYFALL
ncbi:unnamed protein product [Tetraodon nigroviridis]|uniref:(spotted green pufferfish) hypothetical protein n=1 Tax=Tetraodon nigroviridis TaxID=99883 RepID=Q4RW11_TETNG|nr:unnamed protein product [Tetraodon nigroviridis]